MNVLLFVLEIFAVLAGIALVPMRPELRTRGAAGIYDDVISKESQASDAIQPQEK